MHSMHDVKLSSVDLNLLVVLEALLSERHVTRAATRVGLSQSATSHAFARLRELYRDPLLVRSAGSFSLTPRAVALLPAVSRSLSELRATISGEPAFAPRSAQRVFTLGTVDYGQAVLLPRLLPLLEQEAPGIDLAIVNAPNLSELLDEGRIDLTLQPGDTIPKHQRSLELFEDGFVCMVRKRHPSVGSKLTLSQYLALRHVVVAPSGEPGSTVDSELAKRGKQRRVALRVPGFLIVPVIISKSDFINTGPQRLAERLVHVHSVRLLPPPLPIPQFTISMAWHARLDNDPAHTWLRGAVSRVAALR
jgi:DNA-binding transcriptional LysR family regulator